MYCRISLFAFSIEPFCHEQYESAKNTRFGSFAPFGANLHVTGTDPAALEAALRGLGVAFQPTDTSLEDVFIRLMEQSRDNMA